MQVGSCVQISELHVPTDIITHCPSIEIRFPFHLAALLYEKPPNPDAATVCHDKFRAALHAQSGARVWTVREVLEQFPASRLREYLLKFADIRFDIPPGPRPEASRHMFSMEYISQSLSNLSKSHLIDLILLRPRVVIDTDESQSRFNCTQIPLHPLANLTFTRDQQITTARGLVMGRFTAIQRMPETELMAEIWPRLGIDPIARIAEPATLEGGDFISAGKDLAFLGVGVRTNFAAAQQLMDGDLLGTKRLLVVEDKEDLNQERMHLDTFFALCDERLCICWDAIAEDRPKFRRIAREFVRNDNCSWEVKAPMPFGEWLKKENYAVVTPTHEQQMNYFSNLLHLGKGKDGRNRILATNPQVEKAIRQYGYVGNVETIDFSPITAMYGGARCATQVLRRPPTQQ